MTTLTAMDSRPSNEVVVLAVDPPAVTTAPEAALRAARGGARWEGATAAAAVPTLPINPARPSARARAQ